MSSYLLDTILAEGRRRVSDEWEGRLGDWGGAGIGGSSALTFAREGARVVVADISPEGGGEPVEVIREAGGEAIFVHVDVAQAGQVQAMIQTTVGIFGQLDYPITMLASSPGWQSSPMTGARMNFVNPCSSGRGPAELRATLGRYRYLACH